MTNSKPDLYDESLLRAGLARLETLTAKQEYMKAEARQHGADRVIDFLVAVCEVNAHHFNLPRHGDERQP